VKDFLLAIVKLCSAALLFPILIACILIFKEHLLVYPSTYSEFFIWGVGGFIIVFLFLYQFWSVFEFGQSSMSELTKFMAPLNQTVSRVVSFYLILIMIGFYVVMNFFNGQEYSPYFLFFTGFFFAMHILLVAQQLQDEEKTPIKPGYLFWMMLIFIFNIFMIVVSLDLVTSDFTFPQFFSDTLALTYDIYLRIWDRLGEIAHGIQALFASFR
jgi:hypothetical protein